jgi:hypothetical protein
VMVVFGSCCRVVWPKQILSRRVHLHNPLTLTTIMARRHHLARVPSSSSDDTTCSSSHDLSCVTSNTPAETPSPEPVKQGKRKRKATDNDEDGNTKASKRPRS